MATYTIISKDHSSWLKSREGGIGSSEVATILGVNPFDTPYQLWLRKTGRVQEVEQENMLMKLGHLLEDAISKLCAEEAGLNIVKSSAAEFVVIDKDKPYFRVSPDRYAYPVGERRNAENRTIIECKSTQKPVDADNISRYWFCQVMYQMFVTRTETAHIAWLVQGRDFGYTKLFYKEDFCRFLAEEVERFWIDNVLADKEPALSNLQDVLIKFPTHQEGKKAYADDNIIEIWSELKDTNDQIKRLESTRMELEDAIKVSMLDAESLVIPASGDNAEKTIATWKSSKSALKFDSASLKNAEPEVYQKYLHEVQGTRRFNLK